MTDSGFHVYFWRLLNFRWTLYKVDTFVMHQWCSLYKQLLPSYQLLGVHDQEMLVGSSHKNYKKMSLVHLNFQTTKKILRNVWRHSKSMFAQDSWVLTPTSPLVCLSLFSSTPPPAPKVRSFWLELTLFPLTSILLLLSLFCWGVFTTVSSRWIN